MVEIFTKSYFESVLPVHKITGKPIWQCEGLMDGEYCYSIIIDKETHKNKFIGIVIRSSIGIDGKSKSTGKDSIRLFFRKGMSKDAFGSKISKYITRTTGWEERLIEQIRILYKRGKKLEACPVCNETLGVFKYKKKDLGLFVKCTNEEHYIMSYKKFTE